MLKQEEEWKHGVEASIAMKDARSKMLQMEKEEMIQEVNNHTILAAGQFSGDEFFCGVNTTG